MNWNFAIFCIFGINFFIGFFLPADHFSVASLLVFLSILSFSLGSNGSFPFSWFSLWYYHDEKFPVFLMKNWQFEKNAYKVRGSGKIFICWKFLCILRKKNVIQNVTDKNQGYWNLLTDKFKIYSSNFE